MPPINDPQDWDRFFRLDAPRRGGPLRALANLLIIGVVLTLVLGGGYFVFTAGLQRIRTSAALTAEAVATQNVAIPATRTAVSISRTATSAVLLGTVGPISTATPVTSLLGRSSVLSGGNLRREPVLDEATVIGQICPGDQVDVLEEQIMGDGSRWYRIRLTALGPACVPTHVGLAASGWANASLLAPLTP